MTSALIDAVIAIRFRYGRERQDGSWTGSRAADLRYEKHTEDISASKRMHHLAG